METQQNILTAGKEAFDFFFALPLPESTCTSRPGSPLLRLTGDALTAGKEADTQRLISCLNALARTPVDSLPPAKVLAEEIFDVFVSYRIFTPELSGGNYSPAAIFLLERSRALCKALRSLTSAVSPEDQKKIIPLAASVFSGVPEDNGDLQQTAAWVAAGDRFSVSRSFRFQGGSFIPTRPDSAKPLNKFFGFPGVRNRIADHFRDFASGKHNVPLLINSLPGYGKTSMVISHTLELTDCVLILPSPEALNSGWRELILPLTSRPDRRFVIFFDDIDPRHTDWYNFRTNVGGAFSLPDNVLMVLSANYEFPAEILSRGRRLSFPVFDELRCSEMIEDFLLDFGLKKPPVNLINLIGADYTEEFGQKKFTELSPRTLMRYLKIYLQDQNKRRTMVEMSMGPLVTKPVGELFYEFNIELMRSLYGEEYIQRLLKEKLRNL